MIIPTKGQDLCLKDINKWNRQGNDQEYVVAGPAGTGKTTIASEAVRRMNYEEDEVLFVTFTGKAALVLMLKGFRNVSTIHSAFMELAQVPIMKDGEPVIKNGRILKKLVFVEKDFIDPKIKLIVLDEWGMVDEIFRRIIIKHGVPILAMGDEHQVPPIFGESPYAKLINFRLWEITRQAEGNGIIQLATRIREGKDLRWYMNFNNDAYVMPKSFLKDKHLLNSDIVLTTKNKTRNYLNSRIRELKGSSGPLPNPGDKLVCRKNSWNMSLDGIPLINGTIGTVVNPIRRSECDFGKRIYRIDFKPDYVTDYNYYEALACDYDFLRQPCGDKEIDKFNMGMKLEYGEAITVHLAQGSQFDNVVYFDDWMGDRDFMRRIRYTAVTRAAEKAYMFI